MIHSRKKWGMWFVYLPLALLLLVLFFRQLALTTEYPSAYFFLLLLAVVVGLNPIRHNYTYYSFLGGLSLVTYVISGLFPEILLTSLGTIVLIAGSDLKWDQHYYYPLYLLMVTISSFLSAGGYEVANYLVDDNPFAGYQMIPLGVYMLIHFLTTQALSTMGNKYFLENKQTHFLDEHFHFFLKLALTMLPFTYAMLYMYFGMGTIGLFILSIPYLIVTIGAKYYFRVYNHREILMKVNHYSRRLSNKTNVNSVIHSFVKDLPKLFPIEQIAFGQRNEMGEIVLEQIFEKGKGPREPRGRVVIPNDSPVVTATRSKELKVFEKAEDWQKEPLYEGTYQPESVVVLPINIMSEEMGVLLVTHPHQGVYDAFFISLIEVFYMYVLIILNNAYNFEKLEKSNFTDFLTGLPNYRGFATYFDQLVEEEDCESLSLIILDLDHFKKVNDVHGHEAGNEVLKEIAQLLSACKDDKELVARYGGEEFVVLLKDVGREKAFETAENIRVMIENHSCQITQSIHTGTVDGKTALNVTASIGVATYPDNCGDVHDLVRLADDTMYTRSKQGGRNQVSEFEGYITSEMI